MAKSTAKTAKNTSKMKPAASSRIKISGRPLINDFGGPAKASADDSEQEPGLSAHKATVIAPPTSDKVESPDEAEPASGKTEDKSAAEPENAEAEPAKADPAPEKEEVKAEQPQDGGKAEEPKPKEETEHEPKQFQKFVDSREFYVPINSVAHKRSIKVSILLTIIVFLLAVVLIDLMLDSGLILLVQKIPPTHIVTTGSILL
jgi:hypothetical protein